MCEPDVRHHSNFGLCDCGQLANLTGVVHPKLDNTDFGIVRNAQNRERQPYVIVEIASSLPDSKANSQQLCNYILGRRLPGAPGDCNYRPGPFPASPTC